MQRMLRIASTFTLFSLPGAEVVLIRLEPESPSCPFPRLPVPAPSPSTRPSLFLLLPFGSIGAARPDVNSLDMALTLRYWCCCCSGSFPVCERVKDFATDSESGLIALEPLGGVAPIPSRCFPLFPLVRIDTYRFWKCLRPKTLLFLTIWIQYPATVASVSR